MAESVTVSLSGPAFSMLLYETARSSHEQEGFLCGRIVRNESKIITDAEQCETKIEYVININGATPCPHEFFFYNTAGKVDIEKIRDFLGEESLKVVAWYKFRNFPKFTLTLRDKIVHKQLVEIFESVPNLFSLCLLTTDKFSDCSTHTFSQRFVRRHQDMYVDLPLHIVNLSDPNDSYCNAEIPSASDAFHKIVRSLNISSKNSNGLAISSKIQVALQKHIDMLVTKLSDSERKIFQLQLEVKQLKQSSIASKRTNNTDITLENLTIDNGNTESVGKKESEVSPVQTQQGGGRTLRSKQKNSPDGKGSHYNVESPEEQLNKSMMESPRTKNVSYSQALQK